MFYLPAGPGNWAGLPHLMHALALQSKQIMGLRQKAEGSQKPIMLNEGGMKESCLERVLIMRSKKMAQIPTARWWFHIFFIFTPTWENDPI